MANPTVPPAIVKCSQSAIPDVQVHLMPFNITHTGPAALSTYFMVKDAPAEEDEPVVKPSKEEEVTPPVLDESQVSNVSTVVEESITPPEPEDGISKTEASSITLNAVVTGITKLLPKRLLSAFRGRRIHGLEVELPKGYSGFVLRLEDNQNTAKVGEKRKRDEETEGTASKMKKKVKGAVKNAGRLTRKGSKAVTETEEADDDMGDATEDEVMQDTPGTQNTNTRTFVPTGTFSNFIVWNADRRVDEGRDEYIRSLDEWPRMADLIHSF